jgi:hypothetical protein
MNEQIKGILFESQGRFAKFFQDLVACNNHLFASRWHRYEDIYSKTFFDFHHIGKKRTLLKELEAEGGTIMG